MRLVALLALLGCGAEPPRAAGTPASARKVRSPGAPRPAGAPASPSSLAWGDRVAWTRWEDAQAIARAEQKPICLVVYADWCSHCKELAPVFSAPPIASAAAELVMVRQNQDEKPAWLSALLEPYGSYIPRVLFIDPDGTVRADLTSGHPHYPYFYAPMVSQRLLANMRAAAARR